MNNIPQNIPVVLAADNNYAPYLGVCIQSIISNASSENNYSIYVLNSNIDKTYQMTLKEMSSSNISINFFDMSPVLSGIRKNLFACPSTGNDFYSPETYYRLFLPKILQEYDKVLYLDSDMVVCKDVADLFKIDIGDNFIGVTHDLSLLTATNTSSPWSKFFMKYAHEKLLLENIDNYFQAGVMIWNLKKCREAQLTDKFLSTLQRIGTPMYVDQDVMNSTLAGKNIFWIDQCWDVAWDISFWYKESMIPNEWKEDYLNNLYSPYIMHFTSGIKPWNSPDKAHAKIFWKYARMTPFYEEILYKNLKVQISNFDGNIVKDALNYSKNKLRYWRYKFLSKVTFGKMRKHYKNKKKELKKRLKQVRKFLKGK